MAYVDCFHNTYKVRSNKLDADFIVYEGVAELRMAISRLTLDRRRATVSSLDWGLV